MMPALYEKPPASVELDGKRYRLDLAFGKVLQYLDLSSDDNGFSESDVTEIALSWFLPGTKIKKLDRITQVRLLTKIRREYISGHDRKIQGKKSVKTVDFRYDSGYIYAAFLQTYGIDLYECADKLPWCKFMALFKALPDNTAISQIMGIRGRELPVPDKYNRAEIQHLSELKLLYALPSPEKEQGGVQKTLSGLFDLLYAKATASEVR